MDPEAAQALRAPFPAEVIGKLPRATRRDAQKGECRECGGWHGLPAVHLDYVGHAAVTDRLLQVDPGWSWEPVAFAADGGPLIGSRGADAELWIRLTVAGVTRLGVGTAPSNSFELAKQLVSDAIRNAAMRFGVALDLWAKEDLHATAPEQPPELISGGDAERFARALNDLGASARTDWLDRFGVPPAKLPASQAADAERFVGALVAAAGEGS